MEYLTQFKIDDLSHDKSEFIFILESPHKQEVAMGFPAASESGWWMSKAMFNIETPLGELVTNKSSSIPRISILNCSRLPLQISCYNPLRLSEDFSEFLEIQEIKNGNIQVVKQKIKEKLRTKVGGQALKSFRFRLLKSIQNNNNHSKIIVCGVIAQCFFEEATQLNGYIRVATNLQWEGCSFKIFYEYHPSPKSGQWQNPYNMRNLLDFMSCKRA
ncbi:hypothetical protein AB4160_16880 [Shewanella sp. 10N.286.51.B8]|uniref:hypothetical protein n=1 Tax=Shewanella sp. 10N.286.51.B8 TaxID=3229708 RepID=UPI0035544C81